MPDKFKNKYRISSTRLQHWDYGWDAAYFVTICTQHMQCFFGEVINDEMVLSKAGIIADIFWHEIKNHSQCVELGEYIVMPNHVHGIIIINNDPSVETRHGDISVETRHALSLRDPDNVSDKTIGQQRFQNQGENTLSSIVGGYKSAVTKHVNRLGLESRWQSRFHDHIIRDEKSFHRISEYIRNNPAKWAEDKFYGK